MSKVKLDRVAKTSADLAAEQIENLRALFPEAFAEGKVDFDKLRETLGDEVDSRPERYSFNWAGKRDCIRLLQTPSRATLVPAPDESIDFERTGNIFVEGENLEVLKLLCKSYFDRVKMIYIDPPYNTGNDFIYPDNFADPLGTYLKLTGQKDGEGNLLTSNPETSGRYHSAWLSMMYPRLFLARQLLREDGVIFVSIDDRELHNLRMVLNEVFGEECFKNCVIFRRGIKSVQAQFDTVDSLTVGHEYVVMYAKSPATRFKKLYVSLDEAKEGGWNNHWRGTDRPTMRYELFGITPSTGQWRWSTNRSLKAKENYDRMVAELQVDASQVTQEQIDEWCRLESEKTGEEIDLLRLSSSGKPEHYIPPSESKLGSDLWVDLGSRGSAEVAGLFGMNLFDNPKPVGLIQRMLSFCTVSNAGDIVLDFFSGSCSTAQAVLELNRQDDGNRRFIMVQLPEPLSSPVILNGAQRSEESPATGDSSASPQNDSQMRTIADIGKERTRRVISQMKKANEGKLALEFGERPEDLGFRVFKLAESNYKQWTGVEENEPETYGRQLGLFADPLLPEWKTENVIWEVAIKEGYGLGSRIEAVAGLTGNTVFRVTDLDKGQSFLICLDDKLNPNTIRSLNLDRDDLFICRDAALDDEMAANLALQCRVKTI